MKHALVGFILCVSSLAQAQSMEGAGRISLMPGWRYTPNAFFADNAEQAGYPLQQTSPGGPQIVGTFAYAATDALEVAIDLFAGYENLRLANSDDVTSVSYGALAGVRAFWPMGRFVPNIGLGLGPTLVYTTGGPSQSNTERVTTAYFGSAGVTYRFSDVLGATLDVRYLYARGMVPQIGGVNAGGVWANLGVTWYFAGEPARRGAVR